jgi:cell division septal protein FtsQ
MGGTCPVCGRQGTLRSQEKAITTKKRPKFGVFWVLFTIFTAGIGFLLWLIWPRHEEVVSVDRYLQCSACKSRI